MRLSQAKVGLDLDVKNGEIEGTISTQPVCDVVPFFDFLLVRGHVDTFGNSATVVVWDTIDGHNRDFAELKLKLDGIIMTVEPKEGAVRLFPPARIALDPSISERPSEFCEGKREATAKLLKQVLREQGLKTEALVKFRIAAGPSLLLVR